MLKKTSLQPAAVQIGQNLVPQKTRIIAGPSRLGSGESSLLLIALLGQTLGTSAQNWSLHIETLFQVGHGSVQSPARPHSTANRLSEAT